MSKLKKKSDDNVDNMISLDEVQPPSKIGKVISILWLLVKLLTAVLGAIKGMELAGASELIGM